MLDNEFESRLAAPLLVGITSLEAATALVEVLAQVELEAEIDIGNQGWPASLVVSPPDEMADGRRLPWRGPVLKLVQRVDPGSRRLIVGRRRSTSVSIAGPRVAARAVGRTSLGRVG